MKPFSYEWTRIRTIRSTWILSTLTFVVSGLITLGIALDESTRRAPHAVSAAHYVEMLTTGLVTLGSLFAGIVGVFSFGHEYRYATMRPTLTALPRRLPLAIAKFVVPACFIASQTVLALIANRMIVGLICGDSVAFPPITTVLGPLVGAVGFVTLWNLWGASISALFRSQVAGISLMLAWPLIIESLLFAILTLPFFNSLRSLRRFLPVRAGTQMYRFGPPTDIERLDAVSPLVGALTFGGFVLVLIAVSTLLFNKRDA